MSWRERAPVVHLRAETQSVKDLIEDLTGLKDLRRFAEDEHTAILLDVCPGEDSGLAGAVMMTEERERSLSPSTRDSNGGEASLSYRCWTGTGTAPREVCVASVVRGLVEEWRERGVLASNAMVAEAMQSLLFEGNSREDGEAAGNGETNGHASVSTSSSSAGKHSMPPSGGAYPRECLTGPGFVVCMGRVRGLARRCVAMARLAQPSAVSLFGAEDVSFVCVVLKPEGRELRAWKELLESANTLAAVFRDRTFFWIAMQVATEEEFRHELALFAERRRQLADVLFEMRTMGRSPPADTEVENVLAMTATRGRGQMRHRRRRQRDSSDDSDEEAETAASPATSPTRRHGPVPAWLPGLEPPGGLGRGIVEDVKRRWKWYRSDFTDGMTDRRSLLKYFSAVVSFYFMIVLPVVAFGMVDQYSTDRAFGVMEGLVTQAVGGCVFALFAGQPLVIISLTGPLTVYNLAIANWAKALNTPFLPFYAWTGIWTCILVIIPAVTNLSIYMKWVGRYTEEIFALLVSAVYAGEWVKHVVVENAFKESTVQYLLSMFLSIGTFLTAFGLLLIRRTFFLRPWLRELVSDFGAPVAVISWAALRYVFDNVSVPHLELPPESTRGYFPTTSGRSWFVPLGDLPVRHVFLAIVPAIFLALLFYVDQNISELLTNREENKLKKGGGYHLDLLLLALLTLFFSLLGLPFANGMLPHSPMHARALADTEVYHTHGHEYVRVLRARETRVTALVIHVLIFPLILFARGLLNYVATAVVYGYFLYLGITSVAGNQLWERTLFFFTQAERLPPLHYIRRVRMRRVHLFTAIQVALLVALWFVSQNFYLGDTPFDFGLLFPLVIIAMAPFRWLILPYIFTHRELAVLCEEKIQHIIVEGINV
ncbi:hypothetical protein CDCA_CDCA08G2345 [Cyanidium caldarium]|uniref:Bicarbonate transporter-like transmembrane domain-containing protein n=1 Tax=Cyanidium caldarium TaxID=2771 RepID=A0AAV9IW24_CYACA|nr:hypothetical protein CDCA_CDCA08G2345 [Cyanidium caldarium]